MLRDTIVFIRGVWVAFGGPGKELSIASKAEEGTRCVHGAPWRF